MIYTLTLNPAIDLFIDTPEMRPNTVNRTNGYDVQANGKGVNVSFILHRMGVANTALGIGGGFTLDYITQTLTANGIPNHFVRTDGITRINVFAHVRDQQQEYKLVNPGPKVAEDALVTLFHQLTALTAVDTLIVSGSFAVGISPDTIVTIAQQSVTQGFRLIIDTSYVSVRDTFRYHPFLIKPNEVELASWYGVTDVTGDATLISLARKAVAEGAQNVLVSLGARGAMLITADAIYRGNAPDVEVLNTAGAGDTMLGTFVGGLEQGKNAAANLQYALAAGSDTARSSWITDFRHVDALLPQVHVSKQ